MLLLICSAWEDGETQFFTTRFDQSRLKWLLPVLGSGLGSAWLGARLETRGFNPTLLERRFGLLIAQCPAQLEARLITARASGLGVRLSAARLDSLFGTRLIPACGSGSAWDSVRDSGIGGKFFRDTRGCFSTGGHSVQMGTIDYSCFTQI